MTKEIEILPIESRQLLIEENTTKQIVFFSNNGVAEILIEQKANSQLDIFFINIDGTAQVNLTVNQNGTGAETNLYGVTIGQGEETSLLHSLINHNVPHGKSKQLYKCILADKAQSEFIGELKVLPHAQKVEAYQTNRNILLSEKAKMTTKPQLEIYADDVRCSHGATTGQLDETALFYMQQRCISTEEARMLLMNAFVADVFAEICTPQLREKMAALVERRLRMLAD